MTLREAPAALPPPVLHTSPMSLYLAPCRGFLGWQHNVRGVPVEELSLRGVIPSAERDGVALAFEYIQWLLAERQIGVRTEGLVIRSIMAAAKHVHHDKSQVRARGCQALAHLLCQGPLRRYTMTAVLPPKLFAAIDTCRLNAVRAEAQ